MSKGWNENQIGWKYDDLFEEGYRFDNENLRVWCIVPRDKANNEKDAVEYLVNNINDIEMNQLPLHNVSNRRELLIDFIEYCNQYLAGDDMFVESWVDEFLSNQ